MSKNTIAKTKIRIVPALREDARDIAGIILMAVGDEISDGFASDGHTREDVLHLFSSLTAADNSQYSYLNTLKAVDDDGRAMGYLVAYDGAKLHSLRKAFIDTAKSMMGYDLEGKIPDETIPDEFYLDSLGVFPEYRGRGVASALIAAAEEKAAHLGKTPGLLCDKKNSNARRLYELLGYRKVGETPFAGELMDHLQKER